MAPELVAEFIAEFQREAQKERVEALAARGAVERRLTKVRRDIDSIFSAGLGRSRPVLHAAHQLSNVPSNPPSCRQASSDNCL